MRPRSYNFITLFLALLLAVSSWVPMPGRAEAQMRCAGASSRSLPCARAELPAGLTDEQVYGSLMACCRSMRGGCALMRGCPMPQMSHGSMAARLASAPSLAALTARCLVTLRVSAPVPAPIAVHRSRWLLTASPALAPPLAASAVRAYPAVPVVFWTHSVTLSPHLAPALHGLRAPPAA